MSNIYSSHPVKILHITKHTPSEWTFSLDYKAAEEPGKFVMVSTPGAGEIPISISGFRAESIELTIRNVGSVTSQIFKKHKGKFLYVRGPYGNIFPVEKFYGKHLLVIAGGSGVAAVKPVIDYFYQPDRCTLKQLDVLVGFRNSQNILFRKEIKCWSEWSKRCNVILTVDTHEDEKKEWKGNIGFALDFIKHVKNVDKNTLCVVIGPPRMMINTVDELFKFGVVPDNVWLSFERHMKCGVGKCGHCRIRDKYVCVDGPVFNFRESKRLLD